MFYLADGKHRLVRFAFLLIMYFSSLCCLARDRNDMTGDTTVMSFVRLRWLCEYSNSMEAAEKGVNCRCGMGSHSRMKFERMLGSDFGEQRNKPHTEA